MTDLQQRDAVVAGGESVAWLAKFCEQDKPLRPLLANPWTVLVDGAEWTIATNGRQMVGVRGNFGHPVPSPDGCHSLLSVFAKESASEAVTVDLNALREWVGTDEREPEPPADCPMCKNTGKIECDDCEGEGGAECECSDCGHEHTTTCRTCKGVGIEDCDACDRGPKTTPANYGRIFGTLFNRNLFTLPMRHLPGSVGQWLTFDGRQSMHRLDGEGWRLIVMPMRDSDIPPIEAPEFIEPATAA